MAKNYKTSVGSNKPSTVVSGKLQKNIIINVKKVSSNGVINVYVTWKLLTFQ